MTIEDILYYVILLVIGSIALCLIVKFIVPYFSS